MVTVVLEVFYPREVLVLVQTRRDVRSPQELVFEQERELAFLHEVSNYELGEFLVEYAWQRESTNFGQQIYTVS